MGARVNTTSHSITWKRFIFKVRDVWYSYQTYNDADIVYHMSVPSPVGDEHEEVHTLLTDLSGTQDEIYSRFSKTTRQEISVATRRDELTQEVIVEASDQDLALFFNEYDRFAKDKGIRKAERGRLTALRNSGLLVLTHVRNSNNDILVWHTYRMHPERPMLLNSVSKAHGATDKQQRAVLGRANRYTHWQDMLFFKEQGCRYYDFGGWYNGNDNEALTAVNFFKEGFGGERRKDYLCVSYCTWKGRLFKRLKGTKRDRWD